MITGSGQHFPTRSPETDSKRIRITTRFLPNEGIDIAFQMTELVWNTTTVAAAADKCK